MAAAELQVQQEFTAGQLCTYLKLHFLLHTAGCRNAVCGRLLDSTVQSLSVWGETVEGRGKVLIFATVQWKCVSAELLLQLPLQLHAAAAGSGGRAKMVPQVGR